MTSHLIEGEGPDHERPRKRQKTSTTPTLLSDLIRPSTAAQQIVQDEMAPNQIRVVEHHDEDIEREEAVGILHMVSRGNPGFSGTLKHRYTDFQVNEIMPDGSVAHLTDDKAPALKLDANLKNYNSPRNAEPAHSSSTGPAAGQVAGIIQGSAASDAMAKPLSSSGASEGKPERDEENRSTLEAGDASNSEFVLKPEDEKLLIEYFGEALKNDMVTMVKHIIAKPGAKTATHGELLSAPFTDRSRRGTVHGVVRRIFDHRLETQTTQPEGAIKIFAALPGDHSRYHSNAAARTQNSRQDNRRSGKEQSNGQLKGKLGWEELGGEHLHFSLLKENRDTMEVLATMASLLKMPIKNFSFAGTKDRRAVTVQRVSVLKQHAGRLAYLNNSLKQARIGNFKYEKMRLELGEHTGNEFVITLRDCHFTDDDDELQPDLRLEMANEVVDQATKRLHQNGFLNYFGLQRFGTFSVGTDEIGQLILKGDFEDACNALLHYKKEALVAGETESKIGRDDIARARAIHAWKEDGNAQNALLNLPRKFNAERAVITELSRNKMSFLNALSMIPRNLKTMYVHAYQSRVWNIVASERWARYGSEVVKGDLVLVQKSVVKTSAKGDAHEVDASGEIIIRPASHDVAVTRDDIFERARPLTAAEAASGTYTIFDIVLPTPGFDIEYPANDIGDYYKEYMATESGGGLDPASMRRPQKDFSLSGAYRKIMARINKDFSYEVKLYHDENEDLVETDLTKLDVLRPKRNTRPFEQNGRFSKGTQDNRGFQNGRLNGAQDGGRFSATQDIRVGPDGLLNESQIIRRTFKGTQDDNTPPTTPSWKDDENARPAQTGDKIAQNRALHVGTAYHNAWKALPAKLAADDKAAAEVAELEKAARVHLEVKDVTRPVIQETWIQTSEENHKQRTGVRASTLVNKEADPAATHQKLQADADVDILAVGLGMDVNYVVPTNRAGLSDETSDMPSAITDEKNAILPLANKNTSYSRAQSTTAAGEQAVKHDEGVETMKEIKQEPKPTRLAVILRFQLGNSQYATMALRELMKAGGVKPYKPDFSGGR